MERNKQIAERSQWNNLGSIGYQAEIGCIHLHLICYYNTKHFPLNVYWQPSFSFVFVSMHSRYFHLQSIYQILFIKQLILQCLVIDTHRYRRTFLALLLSVVSSWMLWYNANNNVNMDFHRKLSHLVIY